MITRITSGLRRAAPFVAMVGLLAPGMLELTTVSGVKNTTLAVGAILVVLSSVLLLYRWPATRLLLHLGLLLLPVELFYRYVYKGPISVGVILSTLNTTSQETLELLAAHAALSTILFMWLVISVLIAAVSWGARNPFTLKRCLTGGCLGGALIIISITLAVRDSGSRANVRFFVTEALQKTFPMDVLDSCRITLMSTLQIRRSVDSRAKFEYPGVRMIGEGERRDEQEVYVVVIGESSRPRNWSLYGYGRPTTPRLDQMRRDLIVFDYVSSNATITILSVPLALSRQTPATMNRVAEEKSVLGLLRQGGFRVYWISNQSRYGRNSNAVTAVALEANTASFPEDVSVGQEADSFDENLLPKLRRIISGAGPRDKTVIFLHTMGSHFDYHARYPTNFSSFKGLASPDAASKRDVDLIDAYDNSVLFTDYILREVIGLLTKTNQRAALMYFSDHGERLFDINHQGADFGHGFPDVSREEIEIPFFMWLSPAYQAANQAITARLKEKVRVHADLTSVFDTLVDLVGLTYAGRRGDRSLFSATFQAPEEFQVLDVSERVVTLSFGNPTASSSIGPSVGQATAQLEH